MIMPVNCLTDASWFFETPSILSPLNYPLFDGAYRILNSKGCQKRGTSSHEASLPRGLSRCPSRCVSQTPEIRTGGNFHQLSLARRDWQGGGRGLSGRVYAVKSVSLTRGPKHLCVACESMCLEYACKVLVSVGVCYCLLSFPS